jgi:hypothetical protein
MLRVLALATGLLVSDFAFAHDTWISRFRFVDPRSGDWCCDDRDCGPIDPIRVAIVEGGYLVDQEIFVESSRVLPSEDGRYWTCFSSILFREGGVLKLVYGVSLLPQARELIGIQGSC